MAKEQINSFDDNSVRKISSALRQLQAQYRNLVSRLPPTVRGDIGFTIRTGITTVNSKYPVYPTEGCKFVVKFEDWAFEESVGTCDLDTKEWPAKYVVAKTYDGKHLEEDSRVILVKIPGKKGRRWWILPTDVCCGCPIVEDDFNRPDSTTLGSKWIEFAGIWEIQSNQLKANGAGFIYTAAGHNKYRRNVRVKAKDVQPGKIYRLCAAVKSDGSDYICIELSCGEELVATVSLRMKDGDAIDSFEFSYTAGNDYTLFACLDDSGTFGGLAELSRPVWDCITLEATPRAGVANLGTAAEFDDFGFYKHFLDTDEPPHCIRCLCECDGKCMPRTLTLTLESTCPHRDGKTCTLLINTSFYQNFVWEGVALDWPDPLSGIITKPYRFRLFCPRSTGLSTMCPDGRQFGLCAPDYMGGCSTDDWGTADSAIMCAELADGPSRCSDVELCDPLEIRFGPAACTGSPPPIPPLQCIETLVITA